MIRLNFFGILSFNFENQKYFLWFEKDFTKYVLPFSQADTNLKFEKVKNLLKIFAQNSNFSLKKAFFMSRT